MYFAETGVDADDAPAARRSCELPPPEDETWGSPIGAAGALPRLPPGRFWVCFSIYNLTLL